MSRVRIAETDAEILDCFPTLLELRPHLRREELVERIRRQQREGFQLASIVEAGRVRAVAGFRISESLVSGKFLYVDDLVTNEADRSKGHGGELFDWLVDFARARGCASVQLDSGVQRFGAHRFYLRKRMEIVSHHFALGVAP
jgi:GNAT superfamily N-acetyltransferase